MGFGSADKILSSSAPFYTASSENYLQTVLDFLVRHIQLALAQRNPVAVHGAYWNSLTCEQRGQSSQTSNTGNTREKKGVARDQDTAHKLNMKAPERKPCSRNQATPRVLSAAQRTSRCASRRTLAAARGREAGDGPW